MHTHPTTAISRARVEGALTILASCRATRSLLGPTLLCEQRNRPPHSFSRRHAETRTASTEGDRGRAFRTARAVRAQVGETEGLCQSQAHSHSRRRGRAEGRCPSGARCCAAGGEQDGSGHGRAGCAARGVCGAAAPPVFTGPTTFSARRSGRAESRGRRGAVVDDHSNGA